LEKEKLAGEDEVEDETELIRLRRENAELKAKLKKQTIDEQDPVNRSRTKIQILDPL